MPKTLRTIALSLAAVMLATLNTTVSAAPTEPELQLMAPDTDVLLNRFPGEPVYLELGVFIASVGAPFELRLTRPDYTQPLILEQTIFDPDGGAPEFRELSTDVLDGWNGLKDFLHVEITNATGKNVASLSSTFCPNGYPRERVSDDGPIVASYPESCYANPFTKGMVWGIDEDWAVSPFGFGGQSAALRRGHYTVDVSISDTYVDLFNIDPAKASATLSLEIQNYEYDDCVKGCGFGGRANKASMPPRHRAVPTMETPDPAILPDLIALPAWSFNVENRKKRSFINFSANVWTSGASSLVVEGFRRDDEDVMDAYQYFYVNGEPVGRDQVGTMEFDDRAGHMHWHFLQFAKYSLLSADQMELIKSKKEAFCLAPTDAIDLTLPGVDMSPYLGLSTACGSPGSIWVREILPLGWGDTYVQSIPGQNFNITKLPNGTYYVAVEANPLGTLHEQTDANNTELRMIELGGEPGNRTITVPPWNGIDSEIGYGGGFPDHRH